MTSIIFLVIYFVVLAGITYFYSSKENNADFLNSNKQMGVVDTTWTTFASLLSGFNIVLGVTFSYIYGVWYLMAFVGAGLAFFTFYFVYCKALQNFQDNENFLSVADYFGKVYGGFSRNVVNAILCVSLLLFITVQISVNTGIFALLFEIDKYIALLITTGVIAAYLYLGGFKVSVKTDIFQGILMIPIILTIFYLPNNISVENIKTTFDFSQFWFALGLTFLQYFSLLGQAESFQRVFAVKNREILKRSLKYSFILVCLLAGSVAYLGINFKLGGGEVDVSNLFVTEVLPALPLWLKSFLGVSFVAAFMGTIDSAAFAFGSVLTKFAFKSESKQKIQLFTLLGILVASFLSLHGMSFLTVVFSLISLVSIIGSAFVFSVGFKWSTQQVNVYLVVGVVTFILGNLLRFVTDNPITSLIPIGAALFFVYVLLPVWGKTKTKI